ncbi:MAG: polyamine aminopropyltransferase [Calditrichota bacterium]
MNLRFTENYPEVAASLGIEVKEILYSGKSSFQQIEVFQTEKFGRMLVIDGCIMLTERDEFIYHEMIVHSPLYVHPKPENILVIGGGDGGTVREIVKHPEVISVDLVDIDRRVSEICLEFFPDISEELLSEKVQCLFENGVEFVKKVKQKYDLIIIDSTDPINIGEGLFTADFYQNCYNILEENGILVNQAESPIFTGHWLQSISQKLKRIFPIIHYYGASIPTYPSGLWMFGFASKKYDPLNHFQRQRFLKDNLKLKYYNADIHQASFGLPNYVKGIINAE